MDTPLFILALGAALALSFFMSGMESGVFALSRLRIRRLVRAGKPSAKVLHGYLENSEDFCGRSWSGTRWRISRPCAWW